MPRITRRHIVPGLLALTAVVLIVFIMTPAGSYDTESWDQYMSQSPLHLDLWKQQPQIVIPETSPAPQKSCDRCDVAPEFCSRVGSRNLDLATGYEGSGDRMRRVLAKAARGEPIVFGMIGGSLSRGHGCKCTTFHRQIFDWFNTTWPHAGHQYVDGSVGARGSNYFKFCHVEHLPQDADIVILEAALNDDATPDHAKNMESMLRGILQYKNKPAVLVLSSFSLMGRLHGGGDVHLAVQQYYDVPVINLRHALLPVMQMRPKAVDEFFVIDNPVPNKRDQIHLNAVGHATLANFGIAFLERQKCLLENPRPVVPASDPMFLPAQNYEDEIPRLALLTDSWSTHGVAPVEHPTCATIDSATNPFTPDPATKGWTTWTQPHTTKNYWRATEPGARFEYTVKLTQGHVMLYYLKSAKMGLGRVKCWLNDAEKDAVTIDSYWDDPRSIGMFSAIRDTSKGPLSPGDYVVRCEVIEKHPWGKEEGRGTNFHIIAVLTV